MAEQQPVAKPVVVRLPAEIDTDNALAVGEQLREALAVGVNVVIADMTSTVFCDSAGCRTLLLVHNYAHDLGGQLRLAIASRTVLRVVELLGLDRLLPVYPSVDAALTAEPAA